MISCHYIDNYLFIHIINCNMPIFISWKKLTLEVVTRATEAKTSEFTIFVCMFVHESRKIEYMQLNEVLTVIFLEI